MSEYQYYEFRAIDQPLDRQQIQAVRGCSTRATVTPTRFVNEYHFGDLRGEPRKFLTRFFDVMVYVANWGTRRLMFRVPADLADPEMLKLYETEDVLSVERAGEHVLIDLCSDLDEPTGWIEGEGWMDLLAPLRAEVMGGDHRALYLGWLASLDMQAVDDHALEPPVPPGMQRLTEAQQALARFLRIDADLLDATRQAASGESPEPDIEGAIVSLHETDKDRMLRAVVDEQSQRVRAELMQLACRRLSSRARDTPRRTVAKLRERARVITEQRRREKAQRRAAQAAKQAAQEAAARERRLTAVKQIGERAWRDVEQWIDDRNEKSYARAAARLAELAELARRDGQASGFSRKLADLSDRHRRKGNFLKALRAVGLDNAAPDDT